MNDSLKKIMLKRLLLVLTCPEYTKRRWTRNPVKSCTGPYLCLVAEYQGGVEWAKALQEMLREDGIEISGNGFDPSRAPLWLHEKYHNSGDRRPDKYMRSIRVVWLRHRIKMLEAA